MLSSEALAKLIEAFTEKGHSIRFQANGNSMFPFIRGGNTVIIAPYGNKSPRLGDIIAYVDSKTQKLIVHRIIRLSNDGFVAKGDNCFRSDSYHPWTNILGQVSRINDCNNVLCDIHYTKAKYLIALFSKFGITAIFGRALNKLGIYRYRANSIVV